MSAASFGSVIDPALSGSLIRTLAIATSDCRASQPRTRFESRARSVSAPSNMSSFASKHASMPVSAQSGRIITSEVEMPKAAVQSGRSDPVLRAHRIPKSLSFRVEFA